METKLMTTKHATLQQQNHCKTHNVHVHFISRLWNYNETWN